MLLYLSSKRLGNNPTDIVKLLNGFKQHVGIILNAGDLTTPETKRERFERVAKRFNEIGLSSEQINLADYFGTEKISKKILSRFGLIWVQGGNIFVLRRAYQQSGFDSCITEMIKNNELVYGGESAGAVILGNTFEGLNLVDDPNIVPEIYKYNKECPQEGLGLLEYTIIPHYKSDNPESEKMGIVEAYLLAHNLPYKTLRDGETIIYS